MKTLSTILLASTMLVVPAHAQTTGQGTTGQGTTGQGAGSGEQAAGTCAELRRQAGIRIEDDQIASRDQVMSELEKAGVKNVTVLNTAYLVEATSPDDTCVRMVIDTAGMKGGSGQGAGTGTGDTGSDGTGQSAGSGETSAQGGATAQGQGGDAAMEASRSEVGDVLSEAGYSDVRFLEAAYAVAGEMPNGDTVMLMMSSDAEGHIRQREMEQQSGGASGTGQVGAGQSGSSTGQQKTTD